MEEIGRRELFNKHLRRDHKILSHLSFLQMVNSIEFYIENREGLSKVTEVRSQLALKENDIETIKTRLAFCWTDHPVKRKGLIWADVLKVSGKAPWILLLLFLQLRCHNTFQLTVRNEAGRGRPTAPQCSLRAQSQKPKDTRTQLLIVLLLRNTRKLEPSLLNTKVCEFFTSPAMENCKENILNLSQQYTRFTRIRSDRVSGNSIPGAIFTQELAVVDVPSHLFYVTLSRCFVCQIAGVWSAWFIWRITLAL